MPSKNRPYQSFLNLNYGGKRCLTAFERTKLRVEARSSMAFGIVAIAGRNAATISASIRAIVVSPMPAQTRFVAP
jgi:hypothetical protein